MPQDRVNDLHRFKWRLDAIRQKVITWADKDNDILIEVIRFLLILFIYILKGQIDD